MNRETEHEKYERAYRSADYRMGDSRKADAAFQLSRLFPGAYLDVGCGRGEMLDIAAELKFESSVGVEVVPKLADGERVLLGEAYALPLADKSVDVASLFDVIEHLIPGDDELACRELARVARHHVLLTANSRSSLLPDGTELHINRRPADEWDALFRAWFAPAAVYSVPTPAYPKSPMWRVDL